MPIDLAPGVLLNGRYELRERIGEGGIGMVWEAADHERRRMVAVKMLRSLHRGSEMDARFVREGEILARVRSPFVCRLLSAEIDEETQTQFLVVERLIGRPLDKALPRRRPLPFEEARTYTEHILRGLAAAHAVGIVHRDLKPPNIFLAEDADEPSGHRAVLIDFGVGKFIDAGDNLTSSVATVGSPRYMAPEQLGGSAKADERCDVYAAATVAFRMFTGSLPFDTDKPMNELALKTTYSAPRLSERTGEKWPEPIERFFARCLEKNPRDRPRTGSLALEAWLDAYDELGLTSRVRLDQIEERARTGENTSLPEAKDEPSDSDETPVLPRRGGRR